MATPQMLKIASLSLAVGCAMTARAEDAPPSPKRSADTPANIAATRNDLKQWLDASRRQRPRLPLPPPSADEIAKANARPAAAKGLGGIINNGRMRQLYLPPELGSGGFTRTPDPAMTLTSAFKTEIFWIVSRINNCAYCQGHQEVKLSSEGLTDDQIAALDGDWSDTTPARRAAFEFVRKASERPQDLTAADIDALRPHYRDAQILEILLTLAGNNAMNRWTGTLTIPQEDHRDFLTKTSGKYADAPSRVAPLDPNAKGPACAPPSSRGPAPTTAEIEKALAACRERTPRLPLASEEAARALVPGLAASEPVPQWVRLLAVFPIAGKTRIDLNLAARTKGKLTPKLKAEIAYVGALNDRAWYALGHARERLRELGATPERIEALGDPARFGSNPEGAALALARKITVEPARITDADVDALRSGFDNYEIAEIVFHATEAAFFDRLTEAAGLRLEK